MNHKSTFLSFLVAAFNNNMFFPEETHLFKGEPKTVRGSSQGRKAGAREDEGDREINQGLQEDESRSSGGPGIQWGRAGGQRLERRGKVRGERWGKTWWSQPFLTETP